MNDAEAALEAVKKYGHLQYPVGEDRAALCQAAVVLAPAYEKAKRQAEGQCDGCGADLEDAYCTKCRFSQPSGVEGALREALQRSADAVREARERIGHAFKTRNKKLLERGFGILQIAETPMELTEAKLVALSLPASPAPSQALTEEEKEALGRAPVVSIADRRGISLEHDRDILATAVRRLSASPAEQGVDWLKALAKCDPVVGPFKFVEPRIDPLNFDEKQRYTYRRICGICKRRSADQGENVTHTMECPWIPAKKLVAALPQREGPCLTCSKPGWEHVIGGLGCREYKPAPPVSAEQKENGS